MKTHIPHPRVEGHAACGAMLPLVTLAEGAPPTCPVCAAVTAKPTRTHFAHPNGRTTRCGAPLSGAALVDAHPTCETCVKRMPKPTEAPKRIPLPPREELVAAFVANYNKRRKRAT